MFIEQKVNISGNKNQKIPNIFPRSDALILTEALRFQYLNIRNTKCRIPKNLQFL